MSLRLGLSIPVAILLGTLDAAQLGRAGQPASARNPALWLDDVPTHVLPQPDVERLMREDEERGHWPARYGAVIPLCLASDDSGRWDAAPRGELVWRLRLVSPGARSLGLLLDRYELPESGQLFVHGKERGTHLGAFTRATRQPNGMLAVQPVLGDDLTLEYVQDAGDPGVPVLRLREVIHDYRGILDALSLQDPVFLGGGGCLVDVNCPIGAPYQDIKRSVLFVLFSGSYCSAGLINNTAEDGTPYFLTANHCGDMTNVVAVFGYENAGCGPGGASQAKTISGATLLAFSNRYDSQLYRLSAAPPSSFQPFYAGWDRALNQTGPTISISHPNGSPKKLARDDQAPLRSATRYQTIWEVGKLEPGSSGSPLFNRHQRVIGPACCVTNFTCNGQWAFYGRFGAFWDQKGLGQWLDPLAAGPESVEGFDPFQGQAFVYNGSGVNPLVYASTSPPSVGTTWNATIDTAGMPSATTTWIVGHRARTQGLFQPYGEVLVDTSSTQTFLSIVAPVGGLAQHSNPIPNQPGLIGRVVYTQGLILAGSPLALTNGIELRMR
jgi:hypothetical protein